MVPVFGRKEPFEYINNIDPSTEWWRDFPWWFQRGRGIATTVVVQFTAAFAGFLLDWPHLATGLVFVILGSFALMLYWVRTSRIRRINADEAVHRLTHDIRKQVYDVTTAPNNLVRRSQLESFYESLANNIAEYFRSRTGNPSFNCILRVATSDENGTAYATVARSRGLADERDCRSQTENAQEGIANQFLHQQKQGAYLIHDRVEATRNGIWKLTENDTLGDISSVMTVPVNGWYDNQFDMLGILHLTVREGRLRRADWLPLKAFSDLIGHLLPIVYLTADSEPTESSLSPCDEADNQPEE